MNPLTKRPALTPNEKRWRLFLLGAGPLAFFALRTIEPGSLPAWLPLYSSCGAITGLPCIFCGMTRSIHYLLNGNFGLALYYNWLTFPLLAGALAFFLLYATELLLRRKLIGRWPTLHLTRARFCGALAGVLLLWCLQVYLAVSQHKTELLNPGGPLYSLVVR